ncbi:hypothetical protein PHMEG_0002270 [Phytophthora megakarya]|uniref:ALMS motif domain-containing protein n=1 Tax=Phytophthora megakarya TaxID=4795 RepID=A0A225WZ53_9STRA|nr:hypothetical protein PHMEG_0002270 [Phytophthora megakarya]
MATRRRRRDAALGQIPLSSGEIELYSRQDEAARRRQRLLAVREQERRLAQQVTQRYRDNLRKLQRDKSHATHRMLNLEQQKLLTELHLRYQNSLQNMGTAQRNARLKLLQLMEQAEEEQEKWTFNRQIAGKQRAVEAKEAQEQDERARTVIRRQVEQNMERLRTLSAQQRRQASARARREQEVARQRAQDREELEQWKRIQSPDEVFVTPRPHEKDGRAYQFSRTHCVAPPMPTMEKPVTVIRHNRKHPTTLRGEEEARKYNEEMDQQRERERVEMEEQQEMAAERGKSALDDVTSRHKAQQAFEWLTLVDKMERHERKQQRADGDDFPVHTEVDGETDDPEQTVERAFARMLDLDEEDSVELSSFSVETDEDHSGKLPTTLLGEDGIKKKYSEEMDQHRERKRTKMEKKQEVAAEKAKRALDETSSRKTQQVFERVAPVDKMEKRKQGQQLKGDGVDFPVHTREVDRETDDLVKMMERTFAEILDLDEDSVELSSFSVESDGGKKYTEEMNQQREQNRVVEMEKQQDVTTKRGESVFDDAMSGHKVKQTFERLARLDKMEKRTQGQQRTDGDDIPIHTRKVDREIDDLEQAVERTFARELDLEEDSVESSSFSIEMAKSVDKKSVVSIDNVESSVSESSATPSQKSLSPLGNDVDDRAKFSGDEKINDEDNVLEDSHVASIDEDEGLVSESSFAPSQKSLARLNEVIDGRAKSLEQQVFDQHMMSFSSSSESREYDEESKTEVHCPSIGNDKVHVLKNINPDDPYRRQMDHQARRSSFSAASIAQYSLPPSDTHSSFDDSLDRLYPGHGDDSFVNELVPMFPQRSFAPPQQPLDEDSQAAEEYDVQLDAPNMSRMLTSEQRGSFGRSRQHLVLYEPHHGSAERLRHQSTSTIIKRVENDSGSVHIEKRFSSSSGRSSLGSSNSESDANGADTSVEQSLPQLPAVEHTPVSNKLLETDQAHTAEHLDIYDRSDMSCDSSVSSLGFAVQLNLIAGTTRMSNVGGVRRDVIRHGDIQSRYRGSIRVSDDNVDNQSITSERSFASSSSISMDSHVNYLANTTSRVGKSLPLHLRLPPMIYGRKDMTKPPAPMAWSGAAVSSIASESEADPDESSEAESYTAKRNVRDSNSSVSNSHVKGHSISPARGQYKMDQREHDIDSQQSASQEISDNDSSMGPDTSRAIRVTFDSIKGKVSQLPPPPLGSLNMSQPPPPMHNADQGEDEMTLAEAFKRRHPRFGQRVESHRDKLKLQRDKPQQEQQQQSELRSKSQVSPSSPRDCSATDVRLEKQGLLSRLASGSRAKISSREMKERSRRLYHQLPEVVERKRQEEVMRRRRERLNELREQEKVLSRFGRARGMLHASMRRFSTATSKQVPKKHKKKNHFATAGLPLVLFIVGGYVALTQFVGGKFEARDHMVKSQSEHMFNLEEEHKRMSKKLALDEFELKPVPKPKD